MYISTDFRDFEALFDESMWHDVLDGVSLAQQSLAKGSILYLAGALAGDTHRRIVCQTAAFPLQLLLLVNDLPTCESAQRKHVCQNLLDAPFDEKGMIEFNANRLRTLFKAELGHEGVLRGFFSDFCSEW